MREADCTELAKTAIEEAVEDGDSISWSGEFADRDSLRPDGLVVEQDGDEYVLHAIESKVDPRYFANMDENTYPDALDQLLGYHGNAKWLAVADETLDDRGWDLLEAHCDDAGVGLICCYPTDECEIVTEPEIQPGAFWLEYDVLCELMEDAGWDV